MADKQGYPPKQHGCCSRPFLSPQQGVRLVVGCDLAEEMHEVALHRIGHYKHCQYDPLKETS